VTISDVSEEEALESEKFMAFVAHMLKKKTHITRSIVKMRKSSRRPTRHFT
jgi:hypothetical protein